MKTVRLIAKHRHAGTEYGAGTMLSIEDRTAEWLVSQGVALFASEAGSPALFQPIRTAAQKATRAGRGCCGRR